VTATQDSRLAVGLRAIVTHVVGAADTAASMGSGDVPVLGTPRLLALAEAATVAAVGPRLGAGQTSVGTGVRLEHRRPAPLGAELAVEAELTEIDGPRLVFMFIARGPGTGEDGEGEVIGAGTVERVVLDRERFLARLAGPSPGPSRGRARPVDNR
jgi:fluoroacetyl-CoA thioesterase